MPTDPRPLCRHCHAEPAARPRGLGWRCYYLPGVREQYASKNPGAARKRILCWGCGGAAPGSKRMPDYGWRSREVRIDGHRHTQVACIVCFNTYGWGEPAWAEPDIVIPKEDAA